MAGYLIHLSPSVPIHFKQPSRSGKISSPDNTCIISKFCHGTSVIMVLITAFISYSVYLHTDFSVHDKAQFEYARFGVAQYRLPQSHLRIKIIRASYNPKKHTDHCCIAFTQRLENFNVRNTYSVPTAYQFYTTHRLAWCNAPPKANLHSPHRAL